LKSKGKTHIMRLRACLAESAPAGGAGGLEVGGAGEERSQEEGEHTEDDEQDDDNPDSAYDDL